MKAGHDPLVARGETWDIMSSGCGCVGARDGLGSLWGSESVVAVGTVTR